MYSNMDRLIGIESRYLDLEGLVLTRNRTQVISDGKVHFIEGCLPKVIANEDGKWFVDLESVDYETAIELVKQYEYVRGN